MTALRLYTQADIARLFGVSRQRAAEIVRGPTFPEPNARTVAGAPLWLGSKVRIWFYEWDRKPGRPKKEKP